MTLNRTSYVHKQIRLACFHLEQQTGMKLQTSLNKEFDILKFTGSYSYLTIDFRRQACFVMSHKLTKEETEIIDLIVTCLQWLEIGREYQRSQKKEQRRKMHKFCNKNVTET